LEFYRREVDPNYVRIDISAANTIDGWTVLWIWIEREESKNSSESMCPALRASLDEHERFCHYES
jgi:hypothetical protein